jgi:hypothetical protein
MMALVVVEEVHSSCVDDGKHCNDGYHKMVKALQDCDGNSLVVVEDHRDDMDKEEDGHNLGHVDYDNMAWDDDNLEDKSDDNELSYSYSSFLSFIYTNI